MTVLRASRIRGAFTQRLGLKATALVIALFLWFAVAARRPIEATVAVELRPALDSSLVLLGKRPVMRALVVGRTSDLAKLYTQPLAVRFSVSGDAADTLPLDVTPADVHLPADVEGAVHVLDVQPRHITLHVGRRR